MKHRKIKHKAMVTPCSRFNLGTCRFKEESCWFLHEVSIAEERVENDGTAEKKDNDKDEQVFQKVSENLEPPINTQNTEQEKRKMC